MQFLIFWYFAFWKSVIQKIKPKHIAGDGNMNASAVNVSKGPIKILQITDRVHDYVQGCDLCEEIARAFPGPFYDFTFGVLTSAPDDGLQERVQCKVQAFRFSKKALRLRNVRTLWKLAHYIRAQQFDLIITHRFKSWLLIAAISPFLTRCRFISVFHAFKQFDRRRRQWLARLYLTRRWRLVAVSQAVRADLIAHGVPDNRVVVVHNAIDNAVFQASLLPREEARRLLGLSQDAMIIGTIGRTATIKGHQFLVQAFAQLMAEFPQAYLLIIGGGEKEEQLQRLIQQLRLQGRVFITGAIPNAARYLKAFDVFVLPSLAEGFGLSLLEATLAEVPIVATRVGGVPECVGDIGILVGSGDAAQLAEGIGRVLRCEAEERRQYAARLAQRAAAEFPIAAYHRRYRQIAGELVGATPLVSG